jgi:hypothetical protein
LFACHILHALCVQGTPQATALQVLVHKQPALCSQHRERCCVHMQAHVEDVQRQLMEALQDRLRLLDELVSLTTHGLDNHTRGKCAVRAVQAKVQQELRQERSSGSSTAAMRTVWPAGCVSAVFFRVFIRVIRV